jgi:hypothetical protein
MPKSDELESLISTGNSGDEVAHSHGVSSDSKRAHCDTISDTSRLLAQGFCGGSAPKNPDFLFCFSRKFSPAIMIVLAAVQQTM